MFLVLVMALGLFPISAFAASSTIGGALGEVNITNGGYKMSYLSMNGVVRSQSYTYFNFKSASGAIKEIPAYCINPTTKGVPQSVSPGESIKYIANEASNDPKIVGIIANGYPHRGLSELKLDNKYQAYYATKMALWCYLIDGWSIDRLTVNPSLSGVEKERGEKLLAAAKDIYKRGTWWNRVPQPTITVTADKDSAYPVTIDGKEYLQQVFTADSETWVCDYDIDIGFTMPDEVPEGTRIVDMNNNDITKIRTSPNGASYAGQFKVLYPKDSVSDQTGAVQMSLHANVYKYAIYYALCAETSKYGTLQRYMCDTDPMTGAPISGVTFTVNKADSSTLTTVKTDANGEALLTALDPGVYVVRETSVPDGYLLDSEAQTITLVPNKTGTVRFRNYPKPTLTIDKVDSVTKDPIKGAKFHITYASNNSFTGELNDLGTYFTDENGQIKLTKLRDGWYRVTEVEPAAGYAIKDPATQDCFIQAGTGKVLTFENTPLSALIIKKVDADSGTMLQGAKFRVRYLGGTSGTGGTVIGEYTTSANGTIVITGLKAGTYIVEETKAPTGYEIDDTPQTVYLSGKEQDVVTVEFSNGKHGDLIIDKIDSVTKQPLPGAQFKITTSDGSFVGNYGGTVASNGIYTTDSNGQIKLVDLKPDTYVVTEIKAPDGYVLDSTSQTVKVDRNDTQTLTFTNTPIGGGQIIKVDADSGERIKGVQFEIAKMNGERIGTYTTDSNGVITLPQLADGWYTATEIKAAKGYLLDSTPHNFEMKAGKTTSLTIENTQASSMLIHKIDSVTGKGIYGVTFLVSDSKGNPIGQYTSDQNGYVYIDKTLTDGKYLVREIQAADGYALDTTVKTFYVEYGGTSTITWKNTPITGQIQIVKKSADYNPTNGLPAETLLEGAVFEITDKAGNVVDTIRSNSRGLAVSKQLPLSRYFVREIKAPEHYGINDKELTAYLEYEGQILRFEVEDKSLSTGVAITKTGPKEIVAGQPVRYAFSGIANTSNVSLSNFYWRDTLPAQVRLDTVVTGTYNRPGTYKIVYRVNGGGHRTLADNLSTQKNYTLAASATALKLASNERVTEIMFVFGQAPAGFAQVEKPYLHCKAVTGLSAGSFVNVADVGGTYGGTWVQGISRWVTTVYGKPVIPTLPKTGY